jgi:hypothetical protein
MPVENETLEGTYHCKLSGALAVRMRHGDFKGLIVAITIIIMNSRNSGTNMAPPLKI